jgi:plasmid stabilization system protein ParE
MNIVVRPEAEAEFREAYNYYEARAEGLGNEFLRAVDASLAAIQRHPQMYAVVHNGVRRALLRRFPYGIFYVAEPETIVVIACFHASRDPQAWQGRS